MAHRTVMAVRQPVGVAGLHHLVQHAAAERRLEGLPGDPLRQRRRAQAVGGDAALRQPLCGRLRRGRAARRACSTSSRGSASEAGAALVEHPGVDLVSFTGSAATGRWIAETAGAPAGEGLPRAGRQERARRLRRRRPGRRRPLGGAVVVLERGPAVRSRSSRIVVFDAVYEEFRSRFVEAAEAFADTGPVISEASLGRILDALARAREAGATVLCGGERLPRDGWWLAPTVLEGVAAGRGDLVHRAVRPRDDPLSRAGPVGGARGRQRLAVRPDCGRAHGEPAPCDASSPTRWRRASSS